MKELIRPLAILIVVSSSIAFFLLQFNINFWATFLAATVGQFAVWEIVRYIIKVKTATKAAEMEIQILEELGKQTINVPCAACRKVNLVPIRLDINNSFDCIECGKENAVYIEVESAQVTTPLGENSSESIKVKQW